LHIGQFQTHLIAASQRPVLVRGSETIKKLGDLVTRSACAPECNDAVTLKTHQRAIVVQRHVRMREHAILGVKGHPDRVAVMIQVEQLATRTEHESVIKQMECVAHSGYQRKRFATNDLPGLQINP
jgi:hypothetical protein